MYYRPVAFYYTLMSFQRPTPVAPRSPSPVSPRIPGGFRGPRCVVARPSKADLGQAIPPHAYFLVSAVFHYLGPAFAVLLFSQVNVLGVAWLRIAGAAV